MSTEPKAETSQVDPGDVLFSRVFVPEFAKAAAARGREIKSEEDLGEMLKMAVMLRSQGAAVEQPSVIKEASAKLEAMLVGDAPQSDYLSDPAVVSALAV